MYSREFFNYYDSDEDYQTQLANYSETRMFGTVDARALADEPLPKKQKG